MRGGDPGLGSVVISVAAFTLVTALALPGALTDGVDLEQLWRFAAIGLVVPGVSQILMIFAIRHAGPSRAAILVGTAPLGSVLLAIGLLDEELRPALLAGTALIVAGGAVLALDPGRPVGFRALGVVLAITCAALFAGRDIAVRWVARDVDAPPAQAAAVTLLASSLVAVVYVLATRRTTDVRRAARTTVPAFLPAGCSSDAPTRRSSPASIVARSGSSRRSTRRSRCGASSSRPCTSGGQRRSDDVPCWRAC